MKNKNLIFMILGIIGCLLVVVGLFLPLSVGYTFAGQEIIATLFNTQGIYMIGLIVIAIVLAIIKFYKFILLPVIAIAAFAGIGLYQEMSWAYDMASDYQQMFPGIGFFLVCAGALLMAVYALFTKKDVNDKQKKEKPKKEDAQEEAFSNDLASLKVFDQETNTKEEIITPVAPEVKEEVVKTEETFELPPEIEGNDIPVEENTIQLPIIDPNQTPQELTNNIKANEQYDKEFDIVKATAQELKKDEEAPKLTNVKEDDSWDIETLGDTFLDLPTSNQKESDNSNDKTINVNETPKA